MKLGKLIQQTDCLCAVGIDPDLDVGKIRINSEQVENGDVFICIKGRHGNGHEHIGAALNKGAAVIVTEEEAPQICARYIRVRSTRSFWAAMENNAADRPCEKLKIVAVTGTNGKSSVTRLLASIIRAGGKRCGEIGTLVAKMTTPDPDELYPTLARLANDGCEYVVMEASSHALALDKLAPIRFDGAVFTNLTLDHTDFHGSMEAYGAAKAKLFSMCDAALVNADDVGMTSLAERYARDFCTYSMQDDAATFTAHGLRCSAEGSTFDLLEYGSLFRVNTPLVGRFHAQNALAAAAMARLLGFDKQAVRAGIESVGVIEGRMMPVDAGDDIKVFVDYAHTPDALRSACTSLRECMSAKERLTVVFGCGGERDATKRPIMGAIAAHYADMTIVTSDNSRGEDAFDIIRGILKGIPEKKPHIVIADRRQAISYAVASAKPNDVLLFCGKGHEKYEIDQNGLHSYDEAEEIRKAVKDRRQK